MVGRKLVGMICFALAVTNSLAQEKPVETPVVTQVEEHTSSNADLGSAALETQAPAYTDAPETDAPVETPAPETEAPAETAAPETEAPVEAEPEHDFEWYWFHEQDPRFVDETGTFPFFQPDDDNMNCTYDEHATPFNKQVRGVNLGGWLVLEPWITPTIFYQFLDTQGRYGDEAPGKTAMDSYTFCTALGPEEANRQLRIHWDNWVTEEDFKKLADAGVNSIRIPVGDWMFTPYEPYIGCTEGAVEELDRGIKLAEKYGMDVLIDIHGLIGSQNGFDNSGMSNSVAWTSIASTQPVGTTTFEHWPIRTAEWAGTYDPNNHNYSSINYEHLNQSLTAVERIVERYKDESAVLGLQPVNEPWELTPIETLKEYYWKSYKRIKVMAPKWKFVMHDSFRFGVDYWSTFMTGCPDIALDTHIYQAWMNPGTQQDFYANACQQKYTISAMEEERMPVIVGEWSLGTDNCAMWLNGFNDNLPGFPKVQCQMVDCPINSTYLGDGFPGTPLDITKPIPGPYGTGVSGPSFGKCPVTSDNAFLQQDDDQWTRQLTLKKLNAWSAGHGWYFWNFKAEFAPKWDFLGLVAKGAFPANVSSYTDDVGNEVFEACNKEDNGEFVCRAKRGVSPHDLKNGLAFACNADHVNCTNLDERFDTLTEQADWAFDQYWHHERTKGATCDFGGTAHLMTVPGKDPWWSPAPLEGVGDKVETLTHESWTGFIAIIVGGIVVVVVVGTLIYRWTQRRRRQAYQPIRGN